MLKKDKGSAEQPSECVVFPSLSTQLITKDNRAISLIHSNDEEPHSK